MSFKVKIQFLVFRQHFANKFIQIQMTFQFSNAFQSHKKQHSTYSSINYPHDSQNTLLCVHNLYMLSKNRIRNAFSKI